MAKQPSRKNISAGIDKGEDPGRIRNALAFLKDVRNDVYHLEQDENRAEDDTTATNDTLSDDTVVPKPAEIRSLGRFEIHRQIGQGGFAKVFLATDPQLNRYVALKVLKPTQLSSDDIRSRFDREARAAAMLSHPNIVPVFESGIEGSQRYIASAYCEGVTLKEWSDQKQGNASPEVAAAIVATLAGAVEHAHQRGIVHRDLKPANVLVEAAAHHADDKSLRQHDLAPGDLKITDFGLARYADSIDQYQTAEGAIVGTPVYMSPEQADEDHDVSFASDIYSLGVILYELITGKLPIVGKTHIDTLIAIKHREPTPPRQVNPNIPKDLQAICLKCLNKTPETRYSSAFDLAADLQRWLTGEVIKARPATTVERVRKWCARNPALTIAFTGISIALLLALYQWRTAVFENSRADRHFQLTQSVVEQMVSGVASDKALPPEFRRRISQRSVDLQVQLLDDLPDDRQALIKTALAFETHAKLMFQLGDYDAALEAADQAIEVVDPFADEPDCAAAKMSAVRAKNNHPEVYQPR